MAALAELLRGGQAEALARLQLELATAPPPPAEPVSAVCGQCGQRIPVPPAMFRPPS